MRNILSLHNFRKGLASTDSLLALSILGLVSGFGTGLIVLAFRLSFELPQKAFLPDQGIENYEALSSLSHFLLPLAGALILGLLFHFFLLPHQRRLGVVHVLERLEHSHGYLPAKQFIAQFIAGAVSIIFGHSAGREGAAIHLGSAVSSLMGQRFALPNNSIRILVGCGTAAAISASFNTPVAGVIFAVEVVLLEYTIAAITPLIVASVTGALVTRAVYGHAPAFSVPDFTLSNFNEIPYLIATGIMVGCLATCFSKNACFVAKKSKHWPVLSRFTVAGILIGGGAVIAPQIMGIGYDTVNQTLLGQVPLALLVLITVIKLSVTSTAIGLGMPSGIIGPTLVIGATAGGIIGIIGLTLVPNDASSSGYYAMLGMGAMMGATLRAPLAALTALMELTANTQIILPGMLVIVVASLVCNGFFRCQSIFNGLLAEQGITQNTSPLEHLLNRVGIYSLVETNVLLLPHLISSQHLSAAETDSAPLIIIEQHQQPLGLCEYHHAGEAFAQMIDSPQVSLNLINSLPLQLIKPISPQATLREALLVMDREQVNWLCVELTGPAQGTAKKIYGVVSRQAVVDYYSHHITH